MNNNACITFTNTVEDMVAFNVYHFATSPTLRRTKFRQTWGFIIVMSALCGLLSIINKSFGPLIFGLVWSSLFAFFVVLWYRRAIPRQVRKLYAEGKNKGTLGEQLVRVTDDGLFVKTEASETKVSWPSVERIGETGQYLFVYISAVQALAIPTDRIESGDLAEFADELRRHVGQAD